MNTQPDTPPRDPDPYPGGPWQPRHTDPYDTARTHRGAEVTWWEQARQPVRWGWPEERQAA